MSAFSTLYQRVKASTDQRTQHRFLDAADARSIPEWTPAYIEGQANLLGIVVQAAQMVVGNLTTVDMSQKFGGTPTRVDPLIAIRDTGIPKSVEYQRPFWESVKATRNGKDSASALQTGITRLTQLTDTDLQMAKVRQAQISLRARGVKTYRRVTTSDNPCDLCEVAATQIYYTDDLMPIHPKCSCDIVEDDSDETPGEIPDLIAVHTHGEIGPMLTKAGQHFMGPQDLPNKPGRITGGKAEFDWKTYEESKQRQLEMMRGQLARAQQPQNPRNDRRRDIRNYERIHYPPNADLIKRLDEAAAARPPTITISKGPPRPPKAPKEPFKFTPESYASHAQYVDTTVKTLVEQHKTTMDIFKPNGVWTVERRAQQRKLIDDYWDAHTRGVPRDSEAIMAGGLGGAGKGTVLSKYAGVDQGKYLTLNPDDIKVEMAKRGMIPTVEGLSPMEASPLVHLEASEITNQLSRRAMEQGVNVIHDMTMSSAETTMAKLKALQDNHYRIDSVFVDIPLDTSRVRAEQRHERGEESYRNGKGLGGRFLPSNVTAENAPQPDSPYDSRNRETFEATKDAFDSTVLFDNSGDEPVQLSATGPRWGTLQ